MCGARRFGKLVESGEPRCCASEIHNRADEQEQAEQLRADSCARALGPLDISLQQRQSLFKVSVDDGQHDLALVRYEGQGQRVCACCELRDLPPEFHRLGTITIGQQQSS
jgi:hypothetical protein